MKKKILMIVAVILVGIILFICGFIGGTHTNTKDHLNMNTVVGFDATESGLMLYTEDGSGYYFEK